MKFKWRCPRYWELGQHILNNTLRNWKTEIWIWSLNLKLEFWNCNRKPNSRFWIWYLKFQSWGIWIWDLNLKSEFEIRIWNPNLKSGTEFWNWDRILKSEIWICDLHYYYCYLVLTTNTTHDFEISSRMACDFITYSLSKPGRLFRAPQQQHVSNEYTESHSEHGSRGLGWKTSPSLRGSR